MAVEPSAQIRAPLPEAAVSQHENNPSKRYIKNEWYEWWANKHAGELFNLESISCEVKPKEYVLAVMRVHIGSTFRDGVGFVDLSDMGRTSLTTAVDLAKAEAERDAFDKLLRL